MHSSGNKRQHKDISDVHVLTLYPYSLLFVSSLQRFMYIHPVKAISCFELVMSDRK